MIATLLTNYTLPQDIEALFVEIIIGKIKLLFVCSYNPHKSYNLSLTGNRKSFGISHFTLIITSNFNSNYTSHC